MASPAIYTRHLTKSFGAKQAVKGLTLEVRRGEVFGFLGPNGAGKTTSVKMLLGLVAPTTGEGQVLGCPLGDVAARGKIGFLPEHFRFHDWLTAVEFLRFHGRLYKISTDRLARQSAALLELVGLSDHRDKQLRHFSKGMLQRIGLAQALLNDPDLIFLDEPTSGLDPVGRRLVRDIIRDQRNRGATVFLNSHLLSEIEITCDRVAFIKHGEVLKVSELKALQDGELTIAVRARNFDQGVIVGLQQWSSPVRVDGEHITLNVGSESIVPEILRYLVDRGVEVYSFTPQRLPLEELFIQIVGTDGGL